MTRNYLWVIFALLMLSLFSASAAQAMAVGRFIMVTGKVEVLHHAKLPAAPARQGDGVESSDVIRTKANAKAQIKFMDDSLVTLAPESRLAVSDFSFDAASGERRRVVLRFFKGVFHTIVSRIYQVEEPNFTMETHTSVLGVRGTELYTVILPAATGAYLVSGLLAAQSTNPRFDQIVLLNGMQFTMIPLGQPPQQPRELTPAMLRVLQNLMNTGLSEKVLVGAGTAPSFSGGLPVPEILQFPQSTEPYMQPTIPPTLAPTPTRQQTGGTPGTVP